MHLRVQLQRDLHILSEDIREMNLSFCILTCKSFVAFCHVSMAALLFLSCGAVAGTCKLNPQMPLLAGFHLGFAKGIYQGKWGKEKNIEEKWRGEKKRISFLLVLQFWLQFLILLSSEVRAVVWHSSGTKHH